MWAVPVISILAGLQNIYHTMFGIRQKVPFGGLRASEHAVWCQSANDAGHAFAVPGYEQHADYSLYEHARRCKQHRWLELVTLW